MEKDTTTIKSIKKPTSPLPYAEIQYQLEYLMELIGGDQVLELLELIRKIEGLYKIRDQAYDTNGVLADYIIAQVCTHFDISESEKYKLLGYYKSQKFVDARMLAVHLLRKYTHLTQEKIGQMFGGRTRSCIRNNYELRMGEMYSVKSIEMPLVTRCNAIAKKVELFITLVRKFNVSDKQMKGGTINEAA